MATQTYRPSSVLDGLAYVEYRYDDTTNLVNLVTWANNTDVNVRMLVVDSAGRTVVDQLLAPVPAPQITGSLALTGGRRIKWDTDAYSISMNVPPQAPKP